MPFAEFRLFTRSLGRPICGLLALAASVMVAPARGVSEDAPTDEKGLAIVDDFESGDYSFWSVEGKAFGSAPATGTLANQNPVSGFRGRRLVNTFFGGDASTGTAISKAFTIHSRHLSMLIGGGSDVESVGVELLINDRSVARASGHDSEQLEWRSWDVEQWIGKSARLRIYDHATGGWGHLLLDQVTQMDTPPDRFDLAHQLQQYRESANYLNEPLRPQFHFSPEIHWMNDPNGLVYHDGEYHLFYQYNPAGIEWGHMSWGHAVSKDLLHWEHLPLAIPEADGVMAFSGCCVIDHQNTSGLGEGGKPPMIALYTGHGFGKQVQNLAYSHDRGRTWKQYENNPILDLGEPDFRDPKVFWHSPSERWIMVVSLAKQKVLVFYASEDLKTWQELSRFGPAGAKDKPNWECPDLFRLPVENEAGKSLWVLEADMGGGSIAGGSGGEYFVGEFDGRRFKAIQAAKWVDYGRDFYAPISWSDIPTEDGRRIWIGWMNNWETCLVPTSPWRSCMSVPRSLALRRVNTPSSIQDGGSDLVEYVLVQRPVRELRSLAGTVRDLDTPMATWPPTAVTRPGQIEDLRFILRTTLIPCQERSCGLRIRTGDREFIEVGYDREPSAVYVDRRQSGQVDFHPAFPGRHEAPTALREGKVNLEILCDRSSIEVFINGGEAVISDRFFPTNRDVVIEVFGGGPTSRVEQTSLQPLQSIWRERR